jgi:hypothetical protein
MVSFRGRSLPVADRASRPLPRQSSEGARTSWATASARRPGQHRRLEGVQLPERAAGRDTSRKRGRNTESDRAVPMLHEPKLERERRVQLAVVKDADRVLMASGRRTAAGRERTSVHQWPRPHRSVRGPEWDNAAQQLRHNRRRLCRRDGDRQRCDNDTSENGSESRRGGGEPTQKHDNANERLTTDSGALGRV